MSERLQVTGGALERVRDDIRTLKSTPGWKYLNDTQKKRVCASLLVSERAGPYDYDDQGRYMSIGTHGKEKASNHINAFYCNWAVNVLENNLPLDTSPNPSLVPGFLDTTYERGQSAEHIETLFHDEMCPYVVHVLSDNCRNKAGKVIATCHSFIVMGRSPLRNNELMIIEKVNQGEEYKVTPLSVVLASLRPEKYEWGVRPMKRS